MLNNEHRACLGTKTSQDFPHEITTKSCDQNLKKNIIHGYARLFQVIFSNGGSFIGAT